MSWRTVRLSDLVDNFSVRAKDVGGANGLDFYGVSNEEGIIKTKYAAEDKAEDYKMIEKGCFAYNPYRVNVGSIGLVSDDTRGLISPAYVVFKPKPNSIIPELLLKFLKSDEGLRQIKFYARGTVRQALRFEDLCNIEITIPEYDDQQNLYRKLINSQEASNILDAELKNQLELLKQLRQQLLQDAVQGKLVEQNHKDEPACELLKKIKAEKQKLIAEKKTKSEFKLHQKSKMNPPYELPDNWEWVRFWEIAWCFRGHNPAKIHFKKEPRDGYVRFIQITDFKTDDQAVYVPMSKQLKLVSKGEIVMAAYRHIGKFSREMEGAFNVALCKVNNIEPFSRDFLSILIKSDLITGELLAASKRGHIPSMHTEHLLSLWVPVPPLSEQNRIVQKLDELMQYCNELEASIKKSESQIEKLLQQVLREALRKEPVEV